MRIEGGILQMDEPETGEKAHSLQLPIDHFFRSLAEDQREQAICVVLSGTGSDGTMGLKAVKEHSGMAMVQTPQFRVVLSDIMKEKKAQRQRDETLRQLDLLYRTAPVGLCMLDRELRYVRVNDRLAEINGFPAEMHIGRSVREMVPAVAEEAERLGEEVLGKGRPVLNREVTGETRAQPGVRRTWLEDWWPVQDDQKRVVGVSVVVKEITDLKRAQEELQALNQELEGRVAERTRQLEASHERYRSRIDSIPHMVWSILDENTGEYCNRTTLDYLGMTREEMIGWRWREALHAEGLERVAAEFTEKSRAGREIRADLRIRRAGDGAYRWHSAHLVPMRDEEGRILRWLGTCTDIHDRKVAEERLWEMSRVFQDSTIPILIEDDRGVVLAMNAEAEKVLEWLPGELVGKSLKTVLPEDSYERFDRLLARCHGEGDTVRNEEMVLLSASGKRIPVLLTLSVLQRESEDRPDRTALIAKDIRRLKETEEALMSSERSLMEEKGRLEEKNIALREILEEVEREKSKKRELAAAYVRDALLPILERLEGRGADPSLLAMLKDALAELGVRLGGRPFEARVRLTRRETDVCRMLKGGLSSKEVSQSLGCSVQTVEKHRKNIRKKLGIVGTGTNLGAYLSER